MFITSSNVAAHGAGARDGDGGLVSDVGGSINIGVD